MYDSKFQITPSYIFLASHLSFPIKSNGEGKGELRVDNKH